MLNKSLRKLSLDKETVRQLSDAQLSAVVGGQGMFVAAARMPPTPSITCMTLCGCPNTNQVTMVCVRQ